MSTPTTMLLGRLDGVKKEGKGWVSRCPSCGGQSRKVSIVEGDDGRVLLHCFAGCCAIDVVNSVGLTMADLFVRRDYHNLTPAEQSQMRTMAKIPDWKAGLEVIRHEAIVVALAAIQMGDGVALEDGERRRMHKAARRLFDTYEKLT